MPNNTPNINVILCDDNVDFWSRPVTSGDRMIDKPSALYPEPTPLAVQKLMERAIGTEHFIWLDADVTYVKLAFNEETSEWMGTTCNAIGSPITERRFVSKEFAWVLAGLYRFVRLDPSFVGDPDYDKKQDEPAERLVRAIFGDEAWQ